ncbi:tetratricopeptide repeat protein [Flavobacteriaceae bacterium MAR_2009_75]|nr:tetratricopeptide repeat protein [Flavobacteriaceae bacterium MAR_2009_75]
MKYLTLGLLVLILSSCQTENKEVTAKEDYDKYLINNPVKTTSKYFELWDSKIKSDSSQLMSFGIVGGEYNRYFQNTGDIKYLKKAEKVLEKAVNIAAIGKAGYYRSLARNYISQHRFMEALQMADSARATNNGVEQSRNLLFDVHMELGNYETAQKYLDSTKNMSEFGYLIRLAKWNDYKGDLNTTIRFMEKAMKKAEDSKNTSLKLWSYTNLADYYGHAGKIKDSYEYYLKALAIDPNNAYAKKGIAWIVFSYEKKPLEAMRILDSVTQNYKAPDYYLLKAEIAEHMGDDLKSLSNLDKYFKLVSNPEYGDMYNAYNVSLYLNETEEYDKALRMSRKEVANRPTPESYSLLAYSYFKKGESEKALEIVEQHIIGKTFEPGILLYAAEIYKAAGNKTKVKELKSELTEAVYELGPSTEDSIAQL